MSQTLSHEAHDSIPPTRELPAWRLLRDCTAGEGDERWSALVERCGPALERSVRRLLLRFGEPAEAAAESTTAPPV